MQARELLVPRARQRPTLVRRFASGVRIVIEGDVTVKSIDRAVKQTGASQQLPLSNHASPPRALLAIERNGPFRPTSEASDAARDRLACRRRTRRSSPALPVAACASRPFIGPTPRVPLEGVAPSSMRRRGRPAPGAGGERRPGSRPGNIPVLRTIA